MNAVRQATEQRLAARPDADVAMRALALILAEKIDNPETYTAANVKSTGS